jgi:hypothetical protein
LWRKDRLDPRADAGNRLARSCVGFLQRLLHRSQRLDAGLIADGKMRDVCPNRSGVG